ncbi:mannitol dehydrogenase family protein [Pelagibacterium sp. H642]|uniref:mannitol dehydrogenase family protein n=1 Tax=Pelagibacterium sp. H642 TaxID=1881069 RepID=UPI002815BB6A|nr:mannitol dehydrogenase family protein [Pelagibacterium sp. H642]WMT91860.1 mannitol dehydrogenase family protein [Pelagibacterium sp. H642]
MSIKLSASALHALSAQVAVPGYRHEDLGPGIVHFGVGNFHRAHQAIYLDDLFNLGRDQDWAIVGAGVRESDGQMRQILAGQDYLSTVVEQEAGGTSARITAPMIDFLDPGEGAAIIAKLADPAIRIVSLTITEGGYYLDAKGHFNPTHPEIVADAANFETPRTVFGLILAGLKARREKGVVPFTVMSCDNIPHNGVVTMNAVAGLADLIDPALAGWVRQEVAFPNGMVDRITPATSDREREFVASQYGIADGWPVFCETFKQWVLEDNFPAGRPALEKVGVTFVDDVSPWELMKIRILNGGHAAIAYPSALMDIHFVHEAMEHRLVAAYLEKLTVEEIIPVVPPVPDTDLDQYRRLIAERFANPKIGDTIQRLCLDGSNRQPKFILPSVEDRLAAGASVTGLALVSAFWCRYCYGVSDSGAPIAPNDPSWDRLQTAAIAAKDDPRAFLAMKDIFGSVADNADYVAAFSHALGTIWEVGARETLTRYIENRL